MRFTKASLLGVTLLAVGLASLPVEGRTASRGGAGASRPSHGVRSPQRATAPRSVAYGGAGRTRPGGGGGAARPPHHAQGNATWGHGGYYHGHGGYGYPYYPYYGYYGYGYPYYGYPCGGWGGYAPWFGWGVSVGWGYGGAYAEPVPVPYDSSEPAPEGQAYPAWVETDVTPKRASVRLDGEDVGFAKDWNGVWDRLHITSGAHVLEFSLDGYQTLQVHLDAQPGRVYHVRRELKAGEGLDPSSSAPAPETSAPPPRAAAPSGGGFILLSVDPGDAAVYLDGKFVGRASDLHLRRSRPLTSGEHELEVVRPGFVPERRTVTVEPDETLELRIELRQEAPEGTRALSSPGSAGSSPV